MEIRFRLRILKNQMQNKTTRPLFKQAISAVKKHADSGQYNKKKTQNDNKQPQTGNQFDDMSSGEQQRLKSLGVDLNKTKKITKENHERSKQDSQQGSWKHDKYKANREPQQKLKFQPYPKKNQSFTIKFPSRQQYNKIYQLVKSQKAFIQEINEHYIKFSKEYAFNTCKKILKSEGIEFEDETQNKNQANSLNSKESKQSIFNRLK